MASDNTRSSDGKTPLGRLSYTQGLFELQTQESGKKQWTVSMLFPKGADISALEKLALEAAEKKWPGKAAQMIKDKLVRSPFLDGDGPQGKSKKTLEPHAGYPGHVFIRLASGEDYRPKLFKKNLLPITSKDELYSGCYAYAVVNAYAWYNEKQGNGISFGVSMIQFAKDGEHLGGGGGPADPNEYFEKIADEGEAPETTKTGAGAGGLFG